MQTDVIQVRSTECRKIMKKSIQSNTKKDFEHKNSNHNSQIKGKTIVDEIKSTRISKSTLEDWKKTILMKPPFMGSNRKIFIVPKEAVDEFLAIKPDNKILERQLRISKRCLEGK